MSDDNDDDREYESGPFCRHWGDPADCEEVCGTCGHHCCRHWFSDGDSSCNDCDCEAWTEKESAAHPNHKTRQS